LHLTDPKRLGHFCLADFSSLSYLTQGHAPLDLCQQLVSSRRNLLLPIFWQGSNHVVHRNHSTHRSYSID
jgi:hypothetical protein